MKKILVTLLALIIINCGGGQNQEIQVVNIGSLGAEMKFDVEEFTVKAGSTVRIVMLYFHHRKYTLYQILHLPIHHQN